MVLAESGQRRCNPLVVTDAHPQKTPTMGVEDMQHSKDARICGAGVQRVAACSMNPCLVQFVGCINAMLLWGIAIP